MTLATLQRNCLTGVKEDPNILPLSHLHSLFLPRKMSKGRQFNTESKEYTV